MGVWVRPHKRRVKGKVKKVGVDRKFVWIVKTKNGKKIMMTEKEAEKYMKEHPGVTVYAMVKRYELEKGGDIGGER